MFRITVGNGTALIGSSTEFTRSNSRKPRHRLASVPAKSGTTSVWSDQLLFHSPLIFACPARPLFVFRKRTLFALTAPDTLYMSFSRIKKPGQEIPSTDVTKPATRLR